MSLVFVLLQNDLKLNLLSDISACMTLATSRLVYENALQHDIDLTVLGGARLPCNGPQHYFRNTEHKMLYGYIGNEKSNLISCYVQKSNLTRISIWFSAKLFSVIRFYLITYLIYKYLKIERYICIAYSLHATRYTLQYYVRGKSTGKSDLQKATALNHFSALSYRAWYPVSGYP